MSDLVRNEDSCPFLLSYYGGRNQRWVQSEVVGIRSNCLYRRTIRNGNPSSCFLVKDLRNSNSGKKIETKSREVVLGNTIGVKEMKYKKHGTIPGGQGWAQTQAKTL